MDLLSLIIALAIVGFVLYLINTMVPMPGEYKRWLNIIVILFLVIWVLSALGALDGVRSIRL